MSGSYTQKLMLHGNRVIIRTPTFYRKNGLKFVINPNSVSVLVPLDEHTKQSLSTMETFVKSHVASERYRALWLKEAMFITLSKFCSYEQTNPDGTVTPLKDGSVLGTGEYSILVHASHVYVGPHKKGETFSLSLQVLSISYLVREDVMDILETMDLGVPQTSQAATARPVAAPQPIAAKPAPKKKGRPRKGGEEIVPFMSTSTVC